MSTNKGKLEEHQKVSAQSLSPKEKLILDCALQLLIETGDGGLTMRKLANCADMRLSNVQYYFRSRDDVLKAMVAQFFAECTANLVRMTQEIDAETQRERVYSLVLSGLAHGQEISDMCRAFREIWAISSRNTIVDQCLMDYYRNFSKVIADFALDTPIDNASRKRLGTLLLAYFEGYSITAPSLPLDFDEAAEMLTDLAMSVVD